MHTLHMQPVSLFICCTIWVCYSTLGQLHKRVTDLRVVFVMFTDKLPTLLRLGHRNCVENVYCVLNESIVTARAKADSENKGVNNIQELRNGGENMSFNNFGQIETIATFCQC